MLNINIIVAISKNNVIGYQNKLPWHLPEDLKHFKETTLGQHVLMGKNTFLSIMNYLGKPLPQRMNIIISSTLNPKEYKQFDNVKIYKTLDAALYNINTLIYVIGGEKIYKQLLPHAQKIIVSHIDIECEGDAFFPEIDMQIWHEQHIKIIMHDVHPFKIINYARK